MSQVLSQASASPSVIVNDLRGIREHAPTTPVLLDETGRRARTLTRMGKTAGGLMLAWLVALLFAGLGLVPANLIPFGTFVHAKMAMAGLTLKGNRETVRAIARAERPPSFRVLPYGTNAGFNRTNTGPAPVGDARGSRDGAGGRRGGNDDSTSPRSGASSPDRRVVGPGNPQPGSSNGGFGSDGTAPSRADDAPSVTRADDPTSEAPGSGAPSRAEPDPATTTDRPGGKPEASPSDAAPGQTAGESPRGQGNGNGSTNGGGLGSGSGSGSGSQTNGNGGGGQANGGGQSNGNGSQANGGGQSNGNGSQANGGSSQPNGNGQSNANANANANANGGQTNDAAANQGSPAKPATAGNAGATGSDGNAGADGGPSTGGHASPAR